MVNSFFINYPQKHLEENIKGDDKMMNRNIKTKQATY